MQLINNSGTITKVYMYDAFGVERDKDAEDNNPFRYCGEYYDKETGTIYLRARYYEPMTGRFRNEDPIRSGLNWYTYDKNGNVVTQTDEDGYVKTYSYNAVDLVQTISYTGGKKVDYTYNKIGNLVKMNDWTGETTFELDLLGKIISVNDQYGKNVMYEYDKVGNQTSITYPDGEKIKYEYDALKRLTSIVEGNGKTTSYEYDAVGRPTQLKYPNGISEYYTYDTVGQLLETVQIDKNNTEIKLNSLIYDPQGNVVNSINKDFANTEALPEIATNKYNDLNQLTTKTVKDSKGNIINNYEYSFDKRGNLIKEVDTRNANATKTYTYDSTNKMVKGINEKGESSAYMYNGLGILVKNTTQTKENGDLVKDYVIDYTGSSHNELMSFESNGLNYRYVYGNQKIATTVTDTKSSNNLQLYIQNDRLGSGKYASDIAGNVVAHTYLDEWGNQLEKVKATIGTKSIDVLNNYTNHNYDDILGVYYAKARMYDPANRRFMAVDPIKGDLMNPQTMNPYIYVLNNPVNYIDPDGETPLPAQVVGRVYTIEGVMNGQSVWYVGSTAQELSARFSTHEWQTLIKAPTTTISTVEVTASLDITASGRGTIRSATNEALRSVEQQVINKMRTSNNGTELNKKMPQLQNTWRSGSLDTMLKSTLRARPLTL